ncbi:hypothetical protein MY04_3015 [Flammeovirga sp. MY04]|uniref:hypothetical protein n=1 Tax=Flammeovirga sp. MY04 TaxID=1191459 RepID=UPI0008060EAC|nr:hypothetical protein [Flammeovirga sp. MY04]ANQ50383.1 hypothetical protein MY04_3015 [Flammeovirga sp. MY04]
MVIVNILNVLILIAQAIQPLNSAKELITPQEQNISVDENFLISGVSAGKFKVGREIPVNFDKFQLYKDSREIHSEDGIQSQIYYNVFYGDDVVMQVTPRYDYNKKAWDHKISEIVIQSDKFKTAKGIGVNSTIEEFIAQYPDYEIWYTYISGIYVIESKSERAQFMLDENDFIGKIEIENDLNVLSKTDFKQNSKIKSIRLF